MNDDKALRRHLVQLLRSGEAHVTLKSALDGVTFAEAGAKPAAFAHSAWQLLEHMRIAQRDILDFTLSAAYRPMKWPDDYWPASEAPPDAAAWLRSRESFERDLDEFAGLVQSPERDLMEPFLWGEGQNLFREALLLADHNSYHLGQIVSALRAAGAWRGGS